MSYLGWTIFLICVLAGGALFFSVNNIALRTFSSAKLHDAFKNLSKETRAGKLIKNSERLVLACSFYRLVLNACILLLLIWIFSRLNEGVLGFGQYAGALIIVAVIF